MRGHHTIIIAEVGINHNGDLELAKQLISAAKDAGADAVKFQKRTISRVYTKEELDKPRESPWGTTNRHQKMGLEFGKEQYDEIDRYCKEINMDWGFSCWDLEALEFAKQYKCSFNKVASALLTHTDLLREIAREGKPTFISTGMSTIEEITDAVEMFKSFDCPYILLHCNSQYPCPEDSANLRCITTLKETFKCPIGYSTHCVGIITPVVAVALGAKVIEAHITLDRAMYGSDQAASLEVGGFKKMVEYIRVIESAMGDGVKTVTEAEETCKKKLRRTKDY
jgi:N-acetylneuraminate synthase